MKPTMKIATRFALILPVVALAACETTTMNPTPTPAPRTSAQVVSVGTGDAAAAAAAEARTGVTEGVPAVAAASGSLGTTVASLGDATQGGMWIKTPLVKAAGKGRVVNPATGKSVNVDLIPLGGAASAGSQMSLPAMTSLGVGLTDLPTVEVFSA